MKVLVWNESERFYYPEGITTLESFAEYANAHHNELIALYRLNTDNCVHPYYIEEEKSLFYVNVSTVHTISENDVTILPRREYESRLEEVIQRLCVGCNNYTEDLLGDNLKGHRDRLCLDGTCWTYSKKEE